MRIRTPSVYFLLLLFLFLTLPVSAQLRTRTSNQSTPPPIAVEIRATPAYAEILLRKTELESTVEELLVSYNEEFPKVKNTRYELNLLNAELARFGRLNKSDAGKLTLALGKLIVRRAQLATEFWIISNRYNSAHPNAKKAKRKLEIYHKAVEDIL